MTITLTPADFDSEHKITYTHACEIAGAPGPQCYGNKTCTVYCGQTAYYIQGVPNDCTCVQGGVNCPEPCHDIHINCNQS